jgi:hypothetical protein
MFQEFIILVCIDFFSSKNNRLRNKLLLEKIIYDITSINKNILRNNILFIFIISKRIF